MSRAVGAPDRHSTWLWRIWIYAALYSIALVFANYRTGFHVGLNDFWGNYYHAENLDFANARSLYDGFYPIGYPVLLRGMPVDDLLAAGFLLAAAARVMFIGLFGSLALALVSGPWALIATISLSLIPRMFQHVLTPTADIPMLIPLLSGAALQLLAVVSEGTRRQRVWNMIGAGVLLGAAGLLRQHALAMALGLMIGCALVRPRCIGWVLVAGVSCLLAYSPQMMISMAAGHGPLETSQYVNIYKMTHGVELRDIPLDLTHDIRDIVSADPGRFLRAWAEHLVRMLPLLVPAVVAGFWPSDVTLRRIGRIVAIGGALYLAVVSTGWSHRAVLPILPWTVVLTGAVLHRAIGSLTLRDDAAGRRVVAVGSLVLLVAGMYASNRNARLVSGYMETHHRYALVERLVESTGAVHPKQVYTTDGSLYLPFTPPHFPYFDGTWGLFSLYEYAERYPRLDTSSVESFRRACLREGITHVVLPSNAPNVSKTFGTMLSDREQTTGFDRLGDVGGFTVFRRNQLP